MEQTAVVTDAQRINQITGRPMADCEKQAQQIASGFRHVAAGGDCASYQQCARAQAESRPRDVLRHRGTGFPFIQEGEFRGVR